MARKMEGSYCKRVRALARCWNWMKESKPAAVEASITWILRMTSKRVGLLVHVESGLEDAVLL